MTILIIGKKVPEGFEEEAGSIHLGDGAWIFKCKIKDAKSTNRVIGCGKDFDIGNVLCSVCGETKTNGKTDYCEDCLKLNKNELGKDIKR
jgi:hypothetical protein